MLRQLLITGWVGFMAGDVMDGAIPWPTWPPFFIGAAGASLMILRLALAIIDRLAALVAGRPYVEADAHAPAAERAE
jgi:hypothetical protein